MKRGEVSWLIAGAMICLAAFGPLITAGIYVVDGLIYFGVLALLRGRA